MGANSRLGAYSNKYGILLFTFFKYQIKWNNQMLRTEGLCSVMSEHLSIYVLFFRLVYLRVFPLCLFCLARWLYFLANGHKYDKYWAVSLLVSSVTVIICVVTRRFSLKECYVTTQTQPLLAWRHNERLRRRLPKWWLCIYFYVHFDPHVRFVDFVAGHVGLRHFFEP